MILGNCLTSEEENVAGCKWVFMVKYKSDRTIERPDWLLKLYLDANIDYDEGTLVAKLNSIRVIFSLSALLIGKYTRWM